MAAGAMVEMGAGIAGPCTLAVESPLPDSRWSVFYEKPLREKALPAAGVPQ